jgi:hypothetical protein
MIMAIVENNTFEIGLWTLILVVYLTSLVVLYLVLRKKQNLKETPTK